MKKPLRFLLIFASGLCCLLVVSAFVKSDPKPDKFISKPQTEAPVSIAKIESNHDDLGSLMSKVAFELKGRTVSGKEFYGQEITVDGNENLDRVLVGVTNNLISRIEVWNGGELVETKELGFVGKMTWGEEQTMAVEFYDQTNLKHHGRSNLSLRFNNGTSFFGDIGTIQLDLTKYGDLTGAKTVSVFSKPLEGDLVNRPRFSKLRIWKDRLSFD